TKTKKKRKSPERPAVQAFRYSYLSYRRPPAPPVAKKPRQRHVKARHGLTVLVLLIVLASRAATQVPGITTSSGSGAGSDSKCVGNALRQLVLVSIGQRHTWACDG